MSFLDKLFKKSGKKILNTLGKAADEVVDEVIQEAEISFIQGLQGESLDKFREIISGIVEKSVAEAREDESEKIAGYLDQRAAKLEREAKDRNKPKMLETARVVRQIAEELEAGRHRERDSDSE